VRLSFWSFGETIEVNLAVIDDALMIDVQSHCSMAMQIEDHGKNRKNVRRLFEALEAQLGPGTSGVPVRICDACGYVLVEAQPVRCPECGKAVVGPPRATERRFRDKLWIGLRVAVVLTPIEVLIVTLADFIGVIPPLYRLPVGIAGIIFLLTLNLGVMAAALGLARLWKPN